MNRTKLLLIGILLLAAILRFWNLGSNPPSLYWDEVSQGYNAYSVLKTGYDEHHTFLPISNFAAFGDYKAPVYIYLDVPFIALLGKTELAVRFPSALFGTLTVLLTYLLVLELFNKKPTVSKSSKAQPLFVGNNVWSEMCALFASFFLAISPWHIQLSRAAYEGNVATFFTVLAICLFFYAKRKNPWIFITSIVSFVFAFYAFNAHRVFIPLFVLILFLSFFKELFLVKKQVVIGILIGIVLMIPFLIYLKSPESRLRFQEVNIFSDSAIVLQSNVWIAQEHNSFVAKLFDNRRVLYSLDFVKHYFDFFNPAYLFFTGDINTRFSNQETGELYLWMLPLILFGVCGLLKNFNRTSLVLCGWFLLAPVAAATARETPHALRSETYIPMYEIFAAVGFSLMGMYLQKYKNIFSVFMCGSAFIIVIFLVNFIHAYFVDFPTAYSADWQYGYKQTVAETEKIKNNYSKIIFTQTYGRPYIYLLYYSLITPQEFWKNSIVYRDTFGFYSVQKVGNYIFENPKNYQSHPGKKILYVGAPGEVPTAAHIINKISFKDGRDAFIIAESK